MFPFQKTLLLVFFTILAVETSAQSAIQKSENYANMDAPFLSIKYLQKHIRKEKNDLNAMRSLANTYFQVNMVGEGQKWLLRANNSPAALAYFKRMNARVREVKNGDILEKDNAQFPLGEYANHTNRRSDCLMLVAAVGVMGLL